MADTFGWYEKLPLAGYKVLVTRPKELVSGMAKKLREQGAEVLELPAIGVKPVEEQIFPGYLKNLTPISGLHLPVRAV